MKKEDQEFNIDGTWRRFREDLPQVYCKGFRFDADLIRFKRLYHKSGVKKAVKFRNLFPASGERRKEKTRISNSRRIKDENKRKR